jgi:Zn-finger nucleic acid-binding protein
MLPAMLRDDLATCPACGRGLDANGQRLVCSACAGVLVPEDDLRAMLVEMQAGAAKEQETFELPFESMESYEPPRRCARCPAQMTKHRLYGMLIDRCEAHGIWFDNTELQTALQTAGNEAPRLSLHEKVVAVTIGGGLTAFYIASTIVRLLYERH